MGLFKKAVISPAQTQGRQDALFHGQGRRDFRARSDQKVHEGERREKRQVCEREAHKRPENAAGGPFGMTQDMLFQQAPIQKKPSTRSARLTVFNTNS